MPGETKHVNVRWVGGLRFEGGAPDGPTISVDGDGVQSPSPVQQLLIAIAACSGADVVSILQKKRVDLQSLTVRVAGLRREAYPRRYVSVHLVWEITGAGADETKARAAIDLSLEKYCSVTQSLNPDIRITYDVKLG
jgi:putative redox protein